MLSEVQLPYDIVKEERGSPAPCEVLKATTTTSPKLTKSSRIASKRKELKVDQLFHVPTFSTEDVFVEKTADMEQEFYFPVGMKKSKFMHIMYLYLYLSFTCKLIRHKCINVCFFECREHFSIGNLVLDSYPKELSRKSAGSISMTSSST